MKTFFYSLAILSLFACKKAEITEVSADLMEVLPETEISDKAFETASSLRGISKCKKLQY